MLGAASIVIRYCYI